MENIEHIKEIVSNFRRQIEEDLRDEENSEEPDQTIIDDYTEALRKIAAFDENKALTHLLDYISEEVGI